MKLIASRLCLGVLACLLVGASTAGNDAGLLTVSISLSKPGFVVPPGTGGSAAGVIQPAASCVSESLSAQNNALVRVVCATGQFVSIEPAPGKPFLGTHGGAFRFNMGAGTVTSLGSYNAGNPYLGTGTITALRIYNANGIDGPLEMLVSF